MSTFTARYRSLCLSCESWIQQDDDARWDDGNVVHAICTDPLIVDKVARAACGKCFQIPAASGVCGCDE